MEGPSNARDGFRPEASCWGRFIIEVLETDLPYWSFTVRVGKIVGQRTLLTTQPQWIGPNHPPLRSKLKLAKKVQ